MKGAFHQFYIWSSVYCENRLETFFTESLLLQTGDVEEIEKTHLAGRGLTKESIELHDVKCRIQWFLSLTYTRY